MRVLHRPFRPLLIVLVLGLIGCQEQAHHQTVDGAVRDDMAAAMRGLYDRIGVPADERPRERALLHEANQLFHYARNAEDTYAAIHSGTIDERRLRGAALIVMDTAAQRIGPEVAIPPALPLLAEQPAALTRGERLLLLGLTKQLAARYRLVLPSSELRRFLGYYVPEDERAP